jgi:hypothetical protein
LAIISPECKHKTEVSTGLRQSRLSSFNTRLNARDNRGYEKPNKGPSLFR